MPTNKWFGLKDDPDHVAKKDKEKNMPHSGQANTRDLGKGAARKAMEAVRKRRQELDEI